MANERVDWIVVSDTAGFLLTMESLADGKSTLHALSALKRCKCPPESHWLGAGQALAFLIEEGIENICVFSKAIGLDEDRGIFEGRHYMNARFRADPSRTPAQAVVANMQVLQQKFANANDPDKFLEALAAWNHYRDALTQAFTAATKLNLPRTLGRSAFQTRAKQQWLATLLFGSGSFSHTLSQAHARHDIDERPPLPVADEPDCPPTKFELGREHGFVTVVKQVARAVFESNPCNEAIVKTLAGIRHYRDFGENADTKIERKDPRWSLMELSAAPENWSLDFQKLRNDDLLIQIVSPIGPVPDWSIGEIFRQRPVRTVVSGSATTGWTFLEPVLVGLAELQKDDEIEVVRLRHREYRGYAYSYAIYLPCGSAISNAGEFWLFHSISGDEGGTSRSYEMMIQAGLKNIPARLVIRQYDVDDDKLQRFIVSKPLAILAARQKRAEERLADLRGALGELAVGELLRREGWPIAETRRLHSLDGEQIDCLAIDPKGNRALLVEVKATLAAIWEDHSFMDGGSLDDILRDKQPKNKGLWREDGNVKQIQRIEKKFKDADRRALCRELGLRDGAALEMQVFVLGEIRVNGAERIASPIVAPDEFIRRCKDAEVPKLHYTAIRLMRDIDADADDRLGQRLFDEFIQFRHRDSWP